MYIKKGHISPSANFHLKHACFLRFDSSTIPSAFFFFFPGVLFQLLMKCKLVRIAWASISDSVAEWSKALVKGTSLFGGVGSNPTAAKFPFFITSFSIKYSIPYCNFFLIN